MMVHSNVATFKVAAGAIILAVEVEVEDRYQFTKYVC
jgi:hypothetical protein